MSATLAMAIRIALGLGAIVMIYAGVRMFMARIQAMADRQRQSERDFEARILRSMEAQAPRTSEAPETLPKIEEPVAADSPAQDDPTRQQALEFRPVPLPPGHTVRGLEQKLDIAGLLASSGEIVAIPGMEEKALAVRLRNRKSMLIAPEGVAPAWIESQFQRHDFVCLAGGGKATVMRRFEDFLADMMFH